MQKMMFSLNPLNKHDVKSFFVYDDFDVGDVEAVVVVVVVAVAIPEMEVIGEVIPA
jgi:hypothetical protein